jgi:starch synthase
VQFREKVWGLALAVQQVTKSQKVNVCEDNFTMKVFYISAECKPFSKVGGVGDVAGELPPNLKEEGIDIEIITPLYSTVDSDLYDIKPKTKFFVDFNGRKELVQIHMGKLKGVSVLLVKNQSFFEGIYSSPYIYSENIPYFDDVLRFSFFSEVCLQLIREKDPDIVHINDWPLGYLFGRMAIESLPSKRVLTIHNVGYQGNIGKDVIQDWDIAKILNNKQIGRYFVDPRKEWNSVNALRLALELSDRVNTVSPNYCIEITKPGDEGRYFTGGAGLHKVNKKLFNKGKLIGILNGFEYSFEPTDEKFSKILVEKAKMKGSLAHDFNDSSSFLIGFVGRAVEQKFKLLTEIIDGKSVLEHILNIPNVNVAILATGLPHYEAFLKKFANKDNCSVTLAFDKARARQINLGSDIFLMPSLFEPCGIAQMESLCNATPPLVRWTGGLVDTVLPHTDPNGTGFGFDGDNREDLLYNLIKTVLVAKEYFFQNNNDFRMLQRRGFSKRFLWVDTAKEYIRTLYTPI